MYKINVTNSKTLEKKEYEFGTASDAKLYKSYHLKFGEWAEGSYWVFEHKVTPEQKPFIVDEMTEFSNGVILRKYLININWIISEEIATDYTITECWELFRESRNCHLDKSDWTQLADSILSTSEKQEWRKYRQYLRDLPKLHNDVTILNAKIANFQEWKNGER